MTVIGDAVRSALPAIQAQAESLMWDQVRIVARDGGIGDPDPDSFDVNPDESQIYAGPGRIRPLTRVTGNEADAGLAVDARALLVVSVPIAVVTVAPGHIVQVVASTSDPSMVDEELIVMDVERGTQLSARRMTCYVDRRKA